MSRNEIWKPEITTYWRKKTPTKSKDGRRPSNTEIKKTKARGNN